MEVAAGGGEGLRLQFSDGCPHAEVADCLERFLDTTRSLPLLLQVGRLNPALYLHNCSWRVISCALPSPGSVGN